MDYLIVDVGVYCLRVGMSSSIEPSWRIPNKIARSRLPRVVVTDEKDIDLASEFYGTKALQMKSVGILSSPMVRGIVEMKFE
jgi:hypothetical protein